MKFEVYREGATLLTAGTGDWRWRLRGDNGEPIAHGGEGYRNKADCLHAIELVMSASIATVVFDVTQGKPLSKTLLGGWG